MTPSTKAARHASTGVRSRYQGSALSGSVNLTLWNRGSSVIRRAKMASSPPDHKASGGKTYPGVSTSSRCFASVRRSLRFSGSKSRRHQRCASPSARGSAGTLVPSERLPSTGSSSRARGSPAMQSAISANVSASQGSSRSDASHRGSSVKCFTAVRTPSRQLLRPSGDTLCRSRHPQRSGAHDKRQIGLLDRVRRQTWAVRQG